MHSYFQYSPEVLQAIEEKKPILALESTLISHGLPYPHNLEMAQALETIARKHQVVPATIAVINGIIKIGLTTDELNTLIATKNCIKASIQDLAFAIQQKKCAGTTVAATVFCAHQAGIKVFATGGIGGVHRGDAMDVSADLMALSRHPIAVICSGAKSILDIPKTLEFLETLSVPVLGYATENMPGFYSARTNHKLTMRVDTVAALADYLNIHWGLGLSSSVIITNPVPITAEVQQVVIEPAIATALTAADNNNIRGKAITPYLLEAVRAATEGKSLQANMALIKNNVILGAELSKMVI